MKNNISNKPGTDSKQKFEKVESGIYRQKSNGCYYERPHINGRRTWRSLGTANLKLAREELHKRRVKGQVAYAPQNAVATGAVIRCYEHDGYPDRHKEKRAGRIINEKGYPAFDFKPKEVPAKTLTIGQWKVGVGERFYAVEKKGIKFNVGREMLKRPISENELEDILLKSRTQLLSNFISQKNGKPFSAYLVLKDAKEWALTLNSGLKPGLWLASSESRARSLVNTSQAPPKLVKPL